MFCEDPIKRGKEIIVDPSFNLKHFVLTLLKYVQTKIYIPTSAFNSNETVKSKPIQKLKTKP